MGKRLSQIEVEEKLNGLKMNIDKDKYKMVLDWSGYQNKKTPLPCKCELCGNTTERTLKSIDRSDGHCYCEECVKKLRTDNMKKNYDMTKEGVQQKIDKKFPNCYKIIGEYVNNRTPFKVEHIECGYQWNVIITNLMYYDGKCPRCVGVNRKTHEEFVEEIGEIHGDKYVIIGKYVNAKTPIEVKCKCGNEFEATPNKLLKKNRRGCSECRAQSSAETRSTTHKEFMGKINDIHPDIIILSEYNGRIEYINCLCQVCEYQWKTQARSLLQGSGCPRCGGTLMLTFEDFLYRAKETHKDNYDYSEVVYINMSTEVKIKCLKCLTYFEQKPYKHVGGQGCPNCRISKLEEKTKKFLCENSIGFISNYREFDWLKNKFNLELDFYLPEYNMAIECQGKQHFKPIEFYGGQEYLDYVQENDRIKKELCDKNSVKLFYINYNDNVDEKLITILEEIKKGG